MTLSLPALAVLCLFAVGLYGLLALRNLIKLILALQLLVKAALLALVLAGSQSGQLDLGQDLALTVILVDTLVAVVALALAVQVKRQCGTLDVQQLGTLKG